MPVLKNLRDLDLEVEAEADILRRDRRCLALLAYELGLGLVSGSCGALNPEP